MKRNGSTRRWRKLRRRILKASDVCHICGHPGADAADHKVPIARGGTDHPSNLAPAHHDRRCPTCGTKCNREKADKPFAPVIRRSGSLRRPGPPGEATPMGHRGPFPALVRYLLRAQPSALATLTEGPDDHQSA